MIDIKQIKFDCRFFRGGIPCKPNKERGKICDTCDEYVKNEHLDNSQDSKVANVKYSKTDTSNRILIIKLGAAGDVIRSTPLIEKFRESYSEYKIEWLTQNPEVLPENKIDVIYNWDESDLSKIKMSSYQIAINLDKEKETCLLLNEISSEKKFGFLWEDGHISAANDAGWRKLITGMFDKYSKENTLSYQQEIFSICDLEFEGELPVLNVNTDIKNKWSEIFKSNSNKKIIGLNTGCGSRWKTRLWPEDNWIKLIKMLQNDFYPVLLGGPDEDKMNLRYQELTGAFYPGAFSIEEFIAISDCCDVIVSAVSMMMHIATALKKPLVLFNNIFNKNEFELYGNGIILEPAAGCDDYYGQSCTRKIHCMNDITAEKVFNSIVNFAK